MQRTFFTKSATPELELCYYYNKNLLALKRPLAWKHHVIATTRILQKHIKFSWLKSEHVIDKIDYCTTSCIFIKFIHPFNYPFILSSACSFMHTLLLSYFCTLLSRWKMDENRRIVQKKGKQVLEFLAIKRNAKWEMRLVRFGVFSSSPPLLNCIN